MAVTNAPVYGPFRNRMERRAAMLRHWGWRYVPRFVSLFALPTP